MSDPMPSPPPEDRDAELSGTYIWGQAAAPNRPAFPFLDPPEGPDELGRLGGYRVLRLLGHGGMGIVFLAEDPGLKRLVGLKVMRREAAADPKARERFLREARAVATLKCDHVITIYQVGESKGLPFLAMELLKGTTLAAWMKAQLERPPTLAVIKVAKDVLRGLVAAHEKGLVHRDIKPSNLWLEAGSGRIKVLDFGLAWHHGVDARLTQDGELLGTPAFMAPEQAGSKPVDFRADLFSLGAVLYRMLAGHAPYERGSLIATLTALGTESAAPLPLDVPPELRDWIGRLLARDPAWRPASAAEALAEVTAMERKFKQQRSDSSGHEFPISAQAPIPSMPEPPTTAADNSSTTLIAVGSVVAARPNRQWPIRIAMATGGLVLVGYFASLVTTRNPAINQAKRPTVNANRLAENRKIPVPAPVGIPLETTPDPPPDSGPAPAPAPSNPMPEGAMPVPPPAELAVAATPVPPPAEPPAPALPAPTPITWPNDLALPSLKPFAFHPTPPGKSPFDALEARAIPPEERFPWQPRELVAVVGSHARRHWGPGFSAVISPDGRWAATTAHSAFEPAIVWDMATQKPRAVLAEGGPGLIGFTADKRCLFLILGDEVIAYDPGTWARTSLGKLTDDGDRAPSRMDRVGFCEGGWTLVLAHWDQDQLVLFDLRGPKPRLSDRYPMMKPDGISIPALVASEANQVVYRGRSGGFQRVSVRNGRFEDDHSLEIARDPASRTFGLSPKGDRLVAWHQGRAVLWNLSGTSPSRIGPLPQEGLSPGSSLTLSADGRWLAAKAAATRLYRIDGEEPEAIAWLDRTDMGGGGEVAFSKAGDRAILVNSEGFVRFWDLSKAAPTELSPPDPASAFPAPADLVSSPIDAASGRLVVPRYDGPNGQPFGRYEFWSLNGKRPEPAFGPSGLLTLESAGLVYPLGPRRCLSVQATPPFARYHVLTGGQWSTEVEPAVPAPGPWGLLTPGSRGLLTSAFDGVRDLSLWDIEATPAHRRWAIATADRAPPSPYASKVAFSADLRIMATAFPPRGEIGAELILWKELLTDHPTPAARISLPIDAGAMGGYHLALSPDGRFLVHNPHANHELTFVDLSGAKPKESGRFGAADRTSGLRSLAFSPDARRLAWAGERAAGVIDLASAGEFPLPWPAPGSNDWVAFAPDGRHLFLHNTNKTFYVLRFPSWGKAPISPDAKGARPKRP